MDNLNTNRQRIQVVLDFSCLAGAGFCSLHPKGHLVSQIPAFTLRRSQYQLLNISNYKVAVICEIFCNLNIPLVNACVMNILQLIC